MTNSPTDPAPVAIRNRELVEQAVRFSQAFLRRFGRSKDGALAYPRLRVLETLHCNGPARMRDLADELAVPARNLTAIADALESETLVRRRPHPTDRRATFLEITPAGSAAMIEGFTSHLDEIVALFDVLSDRDKKSLLASLSLLAAALETNDPPAGAAHGYPDGPRPTVPTPPRKNNSSV